MFVLRELFLGLQSLSDKLLDICITFCVSGSIGFSKRSLIRYIEFETIIKWFIYVFSGLKVTRSVRLALGGKTWTHNERQEYVKYDQCCTAGCATAF